jgi:UDP-N-acetylmuramate dehydrogenase
MNILTNVNLKNYTTIKIGGPARFLVEIHSTEDLKKICKHASQHNLQIFVIGGGSNSIGRDEGFDGIVIVNKIPGFSIIDDNNEFVSIEIGSGEEWDDVVRRTVDMGLSGIEAMSSIPGTAGAAPVQNVGAYGQEIADSLKSLKAYDIKNDKIIEMSNKDCHFSYRNSIFKQEYKNKYIITSITIRLKRSSRLQPPFYNSLQSYLDQNGITKYTPKSIRDSVINIRKDKLPDVNIKPSAGSFFKNSFINKAAFDILLSKYFDMGNNCYKIPTGWLIEKAGFKGKLLHGIRVYEKNALVLVNESAKSYKDLKKAKEKIVQKIQQLFDVTIEQEPIDI